MERNPCCFFFKITNSGTNIKGTKRILHAAMVTTANISDITGSIQMFSQPSFYLFSTVKTVLCDGTYEGENVANAIKELIDAMYSPML